MTGAKPALPHSTAQSHYLDDKLMPSPRKSRAEGLEVPGRQDLLAFHSRPEQNKNIPVAIESLNQ